MKIAIALATVCLISLVQADDEQERVLNGPMSLYHEICLSESQVSLALLYQLAYSDSLPNDPKVKKYILCLTENSGYMEDGKLHSGRILQKLYQFLHNLNDATKLYDDCLSKDGTDEDIAYGFISCLYSRIPLKMAQLYFGEV